MAFTEGTRHLYCSFGDGTELSLGKLGAAVCVWQNQGKEIMTENLLCGFSLPSSVGHRPS